jgi:Leucine-rich repeat (LRR) protein
METGDHSKKRGDSEKPTSRTNFKYRFLILALFGATLCGCSKNNDDKKDDDGNGQTASQIKLTYAASSASASLEIFLWGSDGIVTVDWGDGKNDNFTFSPEVSEKESYLRHTYTNSGNYSVSITGANKITKFGCEVQSGDRIVDMDISKCTALTNLSCSDNQLTVLDVSKNTALTELECDGNKLTVLDVSKNTALTELYCDENQLTSLNVSNCPALIYLGCSENKLTDIDVSKNTSLVELDLDKNQLTTIDVSKNTALTVLKCGSNKLTKLDVSKNTALTDLHCDNNQFNADGLDALFATLHSNRLEYKSIQIDGNPGAGSCNRQIARDKGWIFFD